MNPDVLLAASPYTTPLAPSFRNTVCQLPAIFAGRVTHNADAG